MKRAIVVDDTATARMHASQQLRDLGYEVRAVINPIVVLVEIEEFKPDIVVLDLNMPGLSGSGLALLIRKSWPGIGVVLWSDAANLEAEARKAGVPFCAKSEPLFSILKEW